MAFLMVHLECFSPKPVAVKALATSRLVPSAGGTAPRSTALRTQLWPARLQPQYLSIHLQAQKA
jgi:hypothetical protein